MNCNSPSCTNPVLAHGLCRAHYDQRRRHGLAMEAKALRTECRCKCGRTFIQRNVAQEYCNYDCRRRAELDTYRPGLPDTEKAKVVRRCRDALLDGVTWADIQDRFGELAWEGLRTLTAAEKQLRKDLIGFGNASKVGHGAARSIRKIKGAA